MDKNRVFLVAHFGMDMGQMFLREEIRKLADKHDIVVIGTEDSTNNDIESVITKLKEELPAEPMTLTIPECMPDYKTYYPKNEPKNFFSNMSNRERRKLIKRK